jgi:subtilisin family serine protease
VLLAGGSSAVGAARVRLPSASEAAPSIVLMRSGPLLGAPSGSARANAAHRTAQRAIGRIVSSLGIHPSFRYGAAIDGFAASLSARQIALLHRDPAVASVTPDAPISVDPGDVDPAGAASTDAGATELAARGIHTTKLSSPVVPTGVRRINADESPLAKIDGKDDPMDVDVAIIDTGIAPHKDLRIAGGHDCTSPDPEAWRDRYGHGTHVAGTVGAIDNGIGVVGVAPGARLWAVKALNDEGRGFISTYLCAIDWVAAQRDLQHPKRPLIEVANMSFDSWLPSTYSSSCGAGADDPMHVAVCGLVDAGVTAVVAAGNDSMSAQLRLPAAYPEAITVSALADFDGKPGGHGSQADICPWYSPDTDDTFANFSNYGAPVDLIAPGKCILSTYLHNIYAWMSGTSMASPEVAGAAALVYANFPGASPELVRQDLLAATNFNWRTSTDPDGHKDPLLDVSKLGPLPDVAVHATPPSAVLERGGTLAIPIALDRTHGLTDPLRLQVSGLPSGVTAELSPSPTTGSSAVLTLRANKSIAAGTANLKVKASGGGRARSDSVAIQLIVGGARMVFSEPTKLSITADPTVHVALRAPATATSATSRTIQRQTATPVEPGTCANATWADAGAAADLASLDRNGSVADGWSFDVPGLADGCVRWLATTTTSSGRVASFASAAVIVDTAAPLAPRIAASGEGVYQHDPNEPIWIRGGASGTLSLALTANDMAAGAGKTQLHIASGTGLSVTSPPGNGNNATAKISWTASATNGAFEARTIDRAGHTGPWRTIDIKVDSTDPGRPHWSWPPSGTSSIVTSTPSLLWYAGSDTGSGFAPLQLVQRQRGAIVTDGSCDGVSFSDDGPKRLLDRHHVESDIVSGYCYRYVLTATDRVGNHGKRVRSGVILADVTPPTGNFTTPNEGTFNVVHSTSITIQWMQHDTGGSGGLISHVLERERGVPVTPGSCDGVSWVPDKSEYYGSSPTTQTGLTAGTCYRWRLDLVDRAHMVGVVLSGSVLISP